MGRQPGRDPLNLAEGASHQEYLYIPETREERYTSFCGVPLVHLLEITREDIRHQRAALGVEFSGSIAGIFDACDRLLVDQSLINQVETEIRSGHWLPEALRMNIQYFAELFRAMDDPYLRARHEDIQHLGNKLYDVWREDHLIGKIRQLPEGPLLLAGKQVSVSDIAAIPLAQLAGIVCLEGLGVQAKLYRNQAETQAAQGILRQ